MRRLLCLFVVVLGAVVVGCGDDGAERSCAELLEAANGGACSQELVYSAPRGKAEIDDLRIGYGSWESLDIIERKGKRTKADFRYVIVRVSITNLTDEPQPIGIPQETEFVQGRHHYKEDYEPSKGFVEDSFVNQAPGRIAPGETVKGAFVYDMPIPAADGIPFRGGRIRIGNFSDKSTEDATQLAVLRLGLRPGCEEC